MRKSRGTIYLIVISPASYIHFNNNLKMRALEESDSDGFSSPDYTEDFVSDSDDVLEDNSDYVESDGDGSANDENFSNFHPQQRPSTVLRDYMSKFEKIDEVVKKQGFSSIYDACAVLIQLNAEFTPGDTDDIRRILSACAQTSSLRKDVCFASSSILADEMRNLISDTQLRQPLNAMTIESVSSFSFEKLLQRMEHVAPSLSQFILNLGAIETRSRNREISDTIAARDNQRKRNIAASTISALCHSNTHKSNTLQSQLGYYLRAAHTPKRVIEVLGRLGHTPCYESVVLGMKSMAVSAANDLREFCLTFPAFFFSFDNINYQGKVRDQRLHNQSGMHNNIVGYVARNPESTCTRMFTDADVDESRLSKISSCRDLIPNEDDDRVYYRRLIPVTAWNIVNQYFKKEIKVYKHNGSSVAPLRTKALYQIPVQQSTIFTLPVSEKDETRINEIADYMLWAAGDVMGYTPEMLRGKKIMVKGDALTTRNIRFESLFLR